MIGLTRQQAVLLRFIREYIADNGIAPSFDEMMDATKLASRNSIHRLLLGLEERGAIRRLPMRSRAIEVISDNGVIPLRLLPGVDEALGRYARSKGMNKADAAADLINDMLGPLA